MKIPKEKPSREELINLRKKLKTNNKNICYSILCNGQVKQLEEFVKNKNICLACNGYHRKKSRSKNADAYLRTKFKFKMGKSCEKCGCDDIYMLDFDHLDKSAKEYEISQVYSSKKIISEITKTRTLCIWCHRLHTQQQIEEQIKKTKDDYEYTYEEDNEIIDSSNYKICKGLLCNGRKRNEKHFYFKKKEKYHYNKCKKCTKYQFHLIRCKNREYLKKIKLKIQKCKQCMKEVTYDTTCCFDFDHINPKNKAINVQNVIKILVERLQHVNHVIRNLLEK